MKENKFIKQQGKEDLELEDFKSGGDYELVTDEEKVDKELIIDDHEDLEDARGEDQEEEILHCLSKLLHNIAAMSEEEDDEVIDLELESEEDDEVIELELEPEDKSKGFLINKEDERREEFINTEEEERSDFFAANTEQKDRNDFLITNEEEELTDFLITNDEEEERNDLIISENDESGDLVIDDAKRNWDLVIDEFKTEDDEKEWHYRPHPVFGDLVDTGNKEDTKTKSLSTLATVLLAGGGALVLGLSAVGVASLVKGYRTKKSKESEKLEQEPEIKTLPAADTTGVKEVPKQQMYPPQPETFRPVHPPLLRMPLFYHPHAG